MKRYLLIVFCIAGFSITPKSLTAEVVILKNDDILIGSIEESGGFVRVETEAGSIQVERKSVERIIRDPAEQKIFLHRLGRLVQAAKAGRLKNLRLISSYKRAEYWKMVARSAIVPGWGQYYAERKNEGYGFFIGSLAAAGLFVKTHQAYIASEKNYFTAVNRTAFLIATRNGAIQNAVEGNNTFLRSYLLARLMFLDASLVRQKRWTERRNASYVFGLVYLINMVDILNTHAPGKTSFWNAQPTNEVAQTEGFRFGGIVLPDPVSGRAAGQVVGGYTWRF